MHDVTYKNHQNLMLNVTNQRNANYQMYQLIMRIL